MPKVQLASSVTRPSGQHLWERAKPLSRDFFDRDPRLVARDLLGKLLLRAPRGSAVPHFWRGKPSQKWVWENLRAGRIVETEAYLGADDAAAHAAAGRTERNSVLFGPPGHAYVYLSYGLHYCLNVSCLPDGVAGCLLFRAIEPLAGFSQMAAARGVELGKSDLRDPRQLRLLASGPARLCQALEITRAEDNGKDMTSPSSGLWLSDDGFTPRKIETSARIGITKSADLPLRYFVAGNPYVSLKRASSE